MGNSQPVQILNRIHDLNEDPASGSFTQPHLLGHQLKQLSLFHILGYQINEIIGFDYFVELDDVRMPHTSENLYLSIYPFLIFLFTDGALIDYLDGNHFFGWDVDGSFNLAESSLTQGRLHVVVLELVFFGLWVCCGRVHIIILTSILTDKQRLLSLYLIKYFHICCSVYPYLLFDAWLE